VNQESAIVITVTPKTDLYILITWKFQRDAITRIEELLRASLLEIV